MTLYFTKDHEWLRVEGDTATVGISNHAQVEIAARISKTGDAAPVSGDLASKRVQAVVGQAV